MKWLSITRINKKENDNFWLKLKSNSDESKLARELGRKNK